MAPPRPKVAPRPGTEELCHIRAWFSIDDHAEAAGEELLDEVVLFVVERRAAERADRRDVVEPPRPARRALEVARRASA